MGHTDIRIIILFPFLDLSSNLETLSPNGAKIWNSNKKILFQMTDPYIFAFCCFRKS